MASKKPAKPKTTKAASKAKAKPSRAVANTAEADQDHVRMTISAGALKSLAIEFDRSKDRASKANGELGAATKAAVEKGLNTVAWGLVNRIRRQALRDSLKARVTVEDFNDYYEKLAIEDMLAANMFAEQEGRKKTTTRKNSKQAAEQTDIEEQIAETEVLGGPHTGEEAETDLVRH